MRNRLLGPSGGIDPTTHTLPLISAQVNKLEYVPQCKTNQSEGLHHWATCHVEAPSGFPLSLGNWASALTR